MGMRWEAGGGDRGGRGREGMRRRGGRDSAPATAAALPPLPPPCRSPPSTRLQAVGDRGTRRLWIGRWGFGGVLGGLGRKGRPREGDERGGRRAEGPRAPGGDCSLPPPHSRLLVDELLARVLRKDPVEREAVRLEEGGVGPPPEGVEEGGKVLREGDAAGGTAGLEGAGVYARLEAPGILELAAEGGTDADDDLGAGGSGWGGRRRRGHGEAATGRAGLTHEAFEGRKKRIEASGGGFGGCEWPERQRGAGRRSKSS